MIRLLPYIIGVAGVALAYWWAWGNGYDAAQAEQSAALQAHVNRALAQQHAQYEQEREIYENGFTVEREIETRIVRIREEAPTVETPECADLGPDWVRLYNDSLPTGGHPTAPDS